MNKYFKIENDDHYDIVAERLEFLCFKKTKTENEDAEIEYLSYLCEQYDKNNYPIDTPDPISFIKYLMELKNMKKKELGEIIGSVSRASELLNYKIKLNLNQIRKIAIYFEYPIDAFTNDYDLKS